MEFMNSETRKNLVRSFAGESQARTRYTIYAQVARKDNCEWIARIFEETAANEAYEVSASFNKPLENYEVIKDYSSDLIYNEKMKDYRTHNGTDVLASEGSKVYAAAKGKVKGVYNTSKQSSHHFYRAGLYKRCY